MCKRGKFSCVYIFVWFTIALWEGRESSSWIRKCDVLHDMEYGFVKIYGKEEKIFSWDHEMSCFASYRICGIYTLYISSFSVH